jgi:uncharacterized protein (TIGR04255 family)
VPFNNYKRVIYKKNPLIEVICQLRFPRILIINEKQPADFQERIRDEYPLFQVIAEQQQQIAMMGAGAYNAPPTPRILQSETINNYQFSSVDEKWRINLTSTFLALSASNYDRWEEFHDHMSKPLAALLEIYRPSFFERIGLRYVNAFRRSSLNSSNVPWTELIQPFVLGFMSADSKINSEVRNQNASVELDIGNGAIAQINVMKGFVGNTPLDSPPHFGFPIINGEESFIVDNDMYMTQKKICELEASLAYLHDFSRELIRSMITDELHDAMEPKTI